MEYELSMPGEYADWSAAAENAAEQLTQFGIKTTVRAINFAQHSIDVNEGRFQMAIRAWGGPTRTRTSPTCKTCLRTTSRSPRAA